MKQKIEQLIAQNQIEQAIERLFEVYGFCQKNDKETDISAHYRNLILISGKLQTVLQEQRIGTIRTEDASIAKQQVAKSLLTELEKLPATVFDYPIENEKNIQTNFENLSRREKIIGLQSTDYEYDVFLTFASQDIEFVRPVCEELRGYGLRVFFSDETLRTKSGKSFFNLINHALKHSKNMVWVCTPNSVHSKYVTAEYEAFFNEFAVHYPEERIFVILAGQGFTINLVPILLRTYQIAHSVVEILDAFMLNPHTPPQLPQKNITNHQPPTPEPPKPDTDAQLNALLNDFANSYGHNFSVQQWIKFKKQVAEIAHIDEEELMQHYETVLQQIAAEKQQAEKLEIMLKTHIPQAAQAFVELQQGKWNHFDWLKFKKEIFARYGTFDEEQLGEILETAKTEYEERKRKEAEELKRKQAEEERKRKEAEELKRKQAEEERKLKEAEELKRKQEEERKRKEEEERKRKEAEELKRKQEEERKRKLLENYVLVKGGTFKMGTDDFDWAKPIHEVKVSDFYMNKFQLTIKEFMDFVNETNSNHPEWLEKGSEYNIKTGTKDYYKKFVDIEQKPIVGVSWYNAVAYCNWLSQKNGLKPCYTINGTNVKCDFTANGYRLPTEAEWEYAARGGQLPESLKLSGSLQKWAGTDNESELGDYAWYEKNSDNTTHPVGQKKPNPLGLYDMTGNVWEWCYDWYNKDYYKNSPKENPIGAESGSSRVFRGGSWNDNASNCRVANRYDYSPGYRNYFFGFRLAKTVAF